jgi:integrase
MTNASYSFQLILYSVLVSIRTFDVYNEYHGASIKEVQERLGHTDVQMTMNIYTHVTNTLKEQTASKFQKYIEF